MWPRPWRVTSVPPTHVSVAPLIRDLIIHPSDRFVANRSLLVRIVGRPWYTRGTLFYLPESQFGGWGSSTPRNTEALWCQTSVSYPGLFASYDTWRNTVWVILPDGIQVTLFYGKKLCRGDFLIKYFKYGIVIAPRTLNTLDVISRSLWKRIKDKISQKKKLRLSFLIRLKIWKVLNF